MHAKLFPLVQFEVSTFAKNIFKYDIAMEGNARFCHLTVDAVEKAAYVWHEPDWIFSDEWHMHRMGQLIYVEKGLQYLHTANRKYLLPPQHCAWIPPGLPHRTTSPEKHVFLRCAFFNVSSDDPFYKEINIFQTSKLLREMILYTEQWSRLLETSAEEADFLKAILSGLPKMCKAAFPLVLPVPEDSRMEGIVTYLNQDIEKNITLPEIAAQFFLSPRTLERLFKKETGLPVAGYIKLLKMIKAVELLSVSEETIQQVAYHVGYNSVPTFSNTFHKVLGIRPQEFRTYLK